MAIGRDQQRQAHDAQRLASFLALAALSQCVAFVEGIDEGEEIGGIKEDLLQVDLELPHHLGHDIALDGGDRLAGHPVHVIPEALT